MTINAQLWQAYREPFFRFLSPPLGDAFAIVTAWNPASQRLTLEQNRLRQQAMITSLGGAAWSEVLVGDRRFEWSEESLAVTMPMQTALSLANRFGQNAIYYVQGETLILVSCLPDGRQESLGQWRTRCL
ncbi:DUF3293 domain-containing protein [Vibrio cholerae]